MPTLHALFVAIDKYKGAPTLTHAKNDLSLFKGHIETYLKKPHFSINSEVLVDGQATKEKVIKAFEKHYQDAQNEDICLFYFAGHGSYISNPPPQLAAIEKGSRALETIVCHNSRSDSYDLADKEIAYLIWEATHNKGFRNSGHFVVIMDCCHSGEGTRLGEVAKLVRTTEHRHTQPISAFYGFDQCDGGYPPQSTHIQLAACAPNENAGDGVFTEHLVYILQTGSYTYEGLIQRLRASVKGPKDDPQTPQLFSSDPGLKNLKFLGGAI